MCRLLNEFQRWSDEGVQATFIPGNHDQASASPLYQLLAWPDLLRHQVSMDGLVHGISLFGLFPNINIATKPLYNTSQRIAFLPW